MEGEQLMDEEFFEEFIGADLQIDDLCYDDWCVFNIHFKINLLYIFLIKNVFSFSAQWRKGKCQER